MNLTYLRIAELMKLIDALLIDKVNIQLYVEERLWKRACSPDSVKQVFTLQLRTGANSSDYRLESGSTRLLSVT